MKSLKKYNIILNAKTHSKLSSVLLLTVALSACGGGGGSDTSSENLGPKVSSFSPNENASDIALDATFSAQFDRDMFAISLTASSVTLRDNTGDLVLSSIAYDAQNNAVSLTPTSNLALLSTYSANLDNTITDLEGRALTNTSWQFMTRDGVWQSEQVIIPSGGMRDTAISMNAQGNGMLVFTIESEAKIQVFAQSYSLEGGWAAFNIKLSNGEDGGYKPQIAMNDAGDIFAVWSQFDGIRNNIWANNYVDGVGWATAEIIEQVDTATGNPQIAVDNNGNAFAVWEQTNGSRVDIMASLFTPVSKWNPPHSIESNIVGDDSLPQIKFDGNGNAIAVWEHDDGVTKNIWANRYDRFNANNNGWESAQLIEMPNADDGDARQPQLALDNDGNALVVWYQYDSVRANIWSNRYDANTGWEAEQLLETVDLGNAFIPQIEMDGNGNGIAVWRQHSGEIYNMMSSRFDVVNGWGAAETIETDDSGHVSRPQVTVDNEGNGIAVWVQADDLGTLNIMSNRFSLKTGWGTAQLIETDTSAILTQPQIASSKNGQAIVVWEHDFGGGVTNLYGTHFK